ncbi:hypothetical protein BUALT_Bualt14G0093900 [Buddleja alternifolia]|uniref:DUF8040 domain-containing protein n=1 Tax=Buddleja alternifolia TaxID=168488 RepID=A0AAV6WTA8_9LAMI|nr:hypothetical protein BUALT_Bualt14G0093900 [Buddleja alternifolia]
MEDVEDLGDDKLLWSSKEEDYLVELMGPLNSEEEQEVEEVFLHGTTKNPLFNDVEDISDSPVEKKSGPSKEEECVDILEKMEGITTMQFVNAIREFKDASIRIIFLRIMSIHVSATSCIDKCFEGMGINRDDLPFYDMEEELDELLELQKLTSSATTNPQEKVPCRTSLLSGKEWVKELLEGHPTRIYENLRMDRRTFVKLCQILCERHYLEDNTERRVSIEEVVAIFLYTIGHNQRQRVSAERFQHSTETINRHVKEVMRALCKLAKELIVSRNLDEIPPEVLYNPKHYPYFKISPSLPRLSHAPSSIAPLTSPHHSPVITTDRRCSLPGTPAGTQLENTRNFASVCNRGKIASIFGFEQVESPKFDFEVIWLKLGSSLFLHLIERDPNTKLPEGPWSATSAVADPKNLPRGHHICFPVANFDSFVQNLKVYACVRIWLKFGEILSKVTTNVHIVPVHLCKFEMAVCRFGFPL